VILVNHHIVTIKIYRFYPFVHGKNNFDKVQKFSWTQI